MTNENKRMLISMDKKSIMSMIENLGKEIESIDLYGKPETIDNCHEILDRIKEKVDQLKGFLPA